METGYIQTYSDNASRQQVIVVVREDWTVSCFDTTLKLLWEKAISHKTHELSTMASLFKIDDVSIYISPLSLEQATDSLESGISGSGGGGIVVVGASMVPRDEAALIKLEEGLVGETGVSEHPELKFRAALEHYSVFALEAGDGHVIWRSKDENEKMANFSW